jgi:hypothetical protein
VDARAFAGVRSKSGVVVVLKASWVAAMADLLQTAVGR